MFVHTMAFRLFLPLYILFSSLDAHFLLSYPTSLGFNSDTENSAPCGGFSVSFSNATDFHVGGDAIAFNTLHPQSDFLYRATLDPTASGNWTVVFPIIAEYGLGAFCEPGISAPAAWAGSQGVLQITQNAEDGIHYQCAAVNFISGASTTMPSVCQNASGNAASVVSDTTLLPASGTATATSSKISVSTTSPSASATKSWATDGMSVRLWSGGILGAVFFSLAVVVLL